LPRRQAQAEYVAGGGNWIAESPYYRSLPTYIDDITRDFGSDAYERMMLDDQVASSVRTYIESILSDPLTVRPWIDDDKDPDYEESKSYAEFAERLLANCSPTRSVNAWLFEMTMGSVSLGNRVAEKVARLEESGQDAGRLVWDRVKVKPRNRTAFVVDGFSNLLGLLAAIPGQGNLVPGAILTPDLLAVSNLLPREKFAILSWNPQEEDPRGTSLLRTVYRLWWEKIQATAEWLKHLTQFGSPSLWGTTAPDAMAEPATDSLGNPLPGAVSISPVQQLLNELLKFRNGYALALPNGSTLQLLQSASAGDAFLKMVEHHERAIDRAILLAARTRMEAKHGSKADSETSQDITGQAVRRAKTWVADMVTRDLIRPMILWNFGPDAAKRLCPYASLAPVEHQDWSQTANAVAPLVASGFLKPSQFAAMYDKLGLPPAEESLTDDQQQGAAPPPAPGDEDFPAGNPDEAPFASGEYQEPLHPRGYGGKWASKGGDHGHEQHTEQLTWRGKVASLLRQALSQPGKSVARVLAAAQAVHAAYREGGFRAVPKVAVLAAYRKAKVSFAKLESRYGRKAAIAMAGAYLSCYAAYAANPVLMLYLPSPTAAVLGTAEALRAILRSRKGRGEARFAVGVYEEVKHPRGYGGKWTEKPRTFDVDQDQRLQEQNRALLAGLTPAESAALKGYTLTDYRHLNSPLWHGKPLAPAQVKQVGHLDAIFARQKPLEQPVRCWRGFSGDEKRTKEILAQMKKAQKAGTVVEWPGYTSTSIHPGLGRAFGMVRFEIQVRHGVYLEGFSGVRGEHEMLLPRGSRFRVLGVQKVQLTPSSKPETVIQLEQL
jgi:hypothetical protein